jgi:hypothetical protein
VLVVTTHGEAFREKLTPADCKQFDTRQLVIRSKAKEGARTYAAFQPPAYMNQLFETSGFHITRHIPGRNRNGFIEQDTWVLLKP